MTHPVDASLDLPSLLQAKKRAKNKYSKSEIEHPNSEIILIIQRNKPAIDWIIGTGYKAGLVRTQVQRQCSNFFRLPHAANGL